MFLFLKSIFRPRKSCGLCGKNMNWRVLPSKNYPTAVCVVCASAERQRVRSNNRRKRNKRHPTGRIRLCEWIGLLATYDYCCAMCKHRGRKHLTMDHIISLSEGGTNTIDNIQPLCVRCHEAKDGHVRHFFWFFRRYYRRVRWWAHSKLKINLPDIVK